MSNVKFIGCLHLGHESLAKFRGFKDSIEHDEYLIAQWNKHVSKKDLVYILGDVTMETDEFYYQLDRLKGRKKVVMGNHDLGKHSKKLLEYVEDVSGMVEWHGYILTHAPIHPMELGRFYGNIHAHIHHKNKLMEIEAPIMYHDEPKLQKTLDKYHCVDAKLLDFIPMDMSNLKK